MSEFEQLYWQFLEVVAAAQDRCEAAVASMVWYDESSQDIPEQVLAEYADSHESLNRIIAAYPRCKPQKIKLASTA